MKVIKRSGIEENLTKKKIFDSIIKANETVNDDEKLAKKQIQRISDSVYEACLTFEEPIPIDKIEDMIEKKLMEAQAYEVAKKYITYRYEKERIRNNKNITEKLLAENVLNQNANMDEFSFGGRLGETASYLTKEYALNQLLSPMAKANHLNNEVYIHDLDHYPLGDHNCLSIPIDDLLKNGFKTRQVDIRPAGSLNTALQLCAVCMQIQSLQQFGGVSYTHLDWSLVPYLRKTFIKYFKNGLKYIANYDETSETTIENIHLIKLYKNNETVDEIEYIFGTWDSSDITKDKDSGIENSIWDKYPSVKQYAMDMTKKELNQGIEGLYHNLNSLQSRSGAQLPFSSINYGTCTLPEGRLIIKSLIDKLYEGVGPHHTTAIFPCGIFQVGKGINLNPGDPNYDLFKLALKCSAKRIYPNYVNIDIESNKGYDVNNPNTYASTMGCLDYNEKIVIRSGKETYKHTETEIKIGDLFEHIRNGKACSYKDQKLQKRSQYIKNEDDRKKFLENGYILYSGESFNQWAINFKLTYGRKPTKLDFKDVVGVEWDRQSVMKNRGADMSLVSKWDSYLELKVCDILNKNGYMQKFAIEECHSEKDYIRNKVFTCLDDSRKQGDIYFPKLNLVFEVNDFYTHSKTSDSEPYLTKQGLNTHIDDYMGYKKGPTYSLNKITALNDIGLCVVELWEDEIRNGAFIDVIGKKLNTKLNNFDNETSLMPKDNLEFQTPRTICIDLEENGMRKFVKDIDGSFVKIKKILRNNNVTNWIKINTTARSLLVTTDHPFINESGQIIAGELDVNDYLLNEDNDKEFITSIERIHTTNYSYDIETETETFVFSGIQSHNCRTFNGADTYAKDPKLVQLKDGRGNISPVSIILPTLAMQAKETVDGQCVQHLTKEAQNNAYVDAFMKIFEKKINEAKQMLLSRFDWQCEQSWKAAKFMYENGTMYGANPSDITSGKVGIRECLKHGTLAIGFIGLAETLQILIGTDQLTKEGRDLGEKILSFYSSKLSEFKQKEKLNFTTYATPAENLCYTSMQKFKDRYGIIPNVSDKEFFTNSFHVPVWHKINPFEKIDIESKWHKYAIGGAIFYCEFDSGIKNNIEALETVVKYAMEHGIQYMGINVPIDECMKCHYQDEIGSECPECGNKDDDGDSIRRLRRITGYLSTTVKHFNKGKQDEVSKRVKHWGDC